MTEMKVEPSYSRLQECRLIRAVGKEDGKRSGTNDKQSPSRDEGKSCITDRWVDVRSEKTQASEEEGECKLEEEWEDSCDFENLPSL